MELVADLGTQYPKENSKFKKRFGIYKCVCGKEFKVQTDNIKSGHTKSCGCLQAKSRKESCITHGLTNHPIFDRWYAMVDRVTNPKNKAYKNYGGRGIKVCKRWLTPQFFIDDMYPTFKEGLTIDRIDNDGDYEPSNCRWADWDTQSKNKRDIFTTNTTGSKWVTYCKSTSKYRVQVVENGKRVLDGRFNTLEEANDYIEKYKSEVI